MSNRLVELGQRIERLKGHTLDNFVPSSSSLISEEEERTSPSSTSKGSEQFDWEREEEMAGNQDELRALEDFANPLDCFNFVCLYFYRFLILFCFLF